MRYLFLVVGVVVVAGAFAFGLEQLGASATPVNGGMTGESAEETPSVEIPRGRIVFRKLERDDEADRLIFQKQQAYEQNLNALNGIRERLAARWQGAQHSERAELINEARGVIFDSLVSDIFPAWYGTTWDFNGVSQSPGEGKIACGYFVTTCLRDAGFNLERIKLAQQPSQTIIKTVVDSIRKDTKITYQKPIGDIAKAIRDQGYGVYIVGLDTHTGFVVNDGNSLAFVHSSYYRPPFSVTAEPVVGVNPLADSKYRIVGKILGDRMVEKWLTGEKFEMKK